MVSVEIEKLTSETKYNFYVVQESELGNSSISRVSFETINLSKEILMKLTFKGIVENLDIVKSLERIMRISPLRSKVLISKPYLQAIKKNINQYKNHPKYIYEVVIARCHQRHHYTQEHHLVLHQQPDHSQLVRLLHAQLELCSPIRYRELKPSSPFSTSALELKGSTSTMPPSP